MAITVNDIKKLSPQAKALIIIVVIFLIGYLYYMYFFSDLWVKKTNLEKELDTVELQIAQKEKIVMQLDKYKEEVAALQDNYKIALLKLPDQREIPGLFHSVALAGKDAGVEFSLFEPKAMIPKTLEGLAAEDPKFAELFKLSDKKKAAPAKKTAKGKGKKEAEPEPFYQEIPVKVTITGQYQSILHFFEKVAKLPRVVNVSDVYIGEHKDAKGRGNILASSCTVKTYMFVDKNQSASEEKK